MRLSVLHELVVEPFKTKVDQLVPMLLAVPQSVGLVQMASVHFKVEMSI